MQTRQPTELQVYFSAAANQRWCLIKHADI
jgi:hypothetical protein